MLQIVTDPHTTTTLSPPPPSLRRMPLPYPSKTTKNVVFGGTRSGHTSSSTAVLSVHQTHLVDIAGVGSNPSSLKKLSISCGRVSPTVLPASVSASVSVGSSLSTRQYLSSVPAGTRQSPPLLPPAALVPKTFSPKLSRECRSDGSSAWDLLCEEVVALSARRDSCRGFHCPFCAFAVGCTEWSTRPQGKYGT